MKTSISHRWPLLVTFLGLAALPASGGAAPRTPDLIWVLPRFDSLGVRSVALLPAASFDKSHRNESFVETMFARALQPAGYRWITPQVAREKIQSAGGDSAVAALSNVILKTGRVDSLSAQRVCSTLRTSALMSVRLDQFEQTQVEWNQSGKPTTTVRLRAALVDSTGRLLWSASGSETGEGQYHEADAGTTGVSGSGLNTTPTTAQGGAPSFEDVTTRLLDRWMKRFPAAASGGHFRRSRQTLTVLIRTDEEGMRVALREAALSEAADEVPVGCAIVHEGLVIGRGHNQTEGLQDATAHAEILAIGAASNALGSWRLNECTLYVTLEPCAMCAGAIVLARLGRVVYGATDPKAGACGSVLDVIHEPRLNHRAELAQGVLAEECGELLRSFFQKKRRRLEEQIEPGHP